MVFSCALFLGFIAWIGYALVLLFNEKSRRAGLISLAASSFSRNWELVRPEATPSGAWTIEINSGERIGPYRLVCRKKLGRMTLEKNIDVGDGTEALYRRVTATEE